MGDRTLSKIGAGTGLAYVVLALLSTFIYPQEPQVGSSAATTLSWVQNHRVALQAGMVVGLFGAAALLWFVCYLRDALAGEDAGASLSPMVFGGGIAVSVVTVLSTMPVALLAFMDAQRGALDDPTVVRMLADLNTVFFSASSVVTGVFVLALGLTMLRGALGTTWLGWLSLIVAVCNGVAVWIAATFSSDHGKGWTVVAWGAFIGFLVVVAVTSGLLLRGLRDVPAGAPSVAVP